MAGSKFNIEVGDRTFVASSTTLDRSPDLHDLAQKNFKAGHFSLDEDPDVFLHVLKYLQIDVFPLLYDSQKGHDYAMYTRVQQLAERLHLTELHEYLAETRYLNAIKTTMHVDAIRDVDHTQDTVAANSTVSYSPQWVYRKSYVCPRRIVEHMGNRNGCGKECRSVRGDGPEEYEHLWSLRLLRTTQTVEFYPEVLTPQSEHEKATGRCL